MLIATKHSGYSRDAQRLYHIPKAPDMTAANTAAASGAKIIQEQWDWTKARQPKIDAQSDRMIAIGEDQYALNRDQQVFQQGLSRKYDDRYWNSVAPMQDQMMAEANSFDTEGKRDELAGLALADVNQAFSSARDQSSRAMGRMGVNPSSGRSMAMGNQMAVAQAAAQSNAMQKVRAAARQEGYGRKVDANAMMSGMSGFSSTAASAAGGYGGSAMTAGGMGMAGMNQGAAGFNTAASAAAGGLQSASSNLRSNAIESAKDPGFDFVAGLATGAVGGWAGRAGRAGRA